MQKTNLHSTPINLKDFISGENIDSNNPWHEELFGFVNSQNISKIEEINQKTKRRIALKVPHSASGFFGLNKIQISLVTVLLAILSILFIYSVYSGNKMQAYTPRKSKLITGNNPDLIQNVITTQASTINNNTHSNNSSHVSTNINQNQSSEISDLSINDIDKNIEILDTANQELNTIVAGNSEVIENEIEENIEQPERTTNNDNIHGFKITGNGNTGTNFSETDVKLSVVKLAFKENLWIYSKQQQVSAGGNHNVNNPNIGNSDKHNSVSFNYSPSEMPQYQGGDDKFQEDLQYELEKINLENLGKEHRSVLVYFEVNAKGNIENINISGKTNSKINNAVKKAIKNCGYWSKAKKSGKKGSLVYNIALTFK